jgi:Putative inner membrane protein (DUF1819)
MNKYNSPYSAAMTGCAFLYYEFLRILPLFMADNAEALLKDEIENNRILQVNSCKARQRFVLEFKRRYLAVPKDFWVSWLTWSEYGQRAGLLYAILKTYKLAFDFHINVTMRKWNSADKGLTKSDIMMELNEIAGRDAFVDSWSDGTKNRCASQYLTFLRQSYMLDERTDVLKQLQLEIPESEYFLRIGEDWFLEACLMYPYEIANIKNNIP